VYLHKLLKKKNSQIWLTKRLFPNFLSTTVYETRASKKKTIQLLSTINIYFYVVFGSNMNAKRSKNLTVGLKFKIFLEKGFKFGPPQKYVSVLKIDGQVLVTKRYSLKSYSNFIVIIFFQNVREQNTIFLLVQKLELKYALYLYSW